VIRNHCWNRKLRVASSIPSRPSSANRFARSERKGGSSNGSSAGRTSDVEGLGADPVSGSEGLDIEEELSRIGRNSAGPTGLLRRAGLVCQYGACLSGRDKGPTHFAGCGNMVGSSNVCPQ
jgi:hypothetical protein